MALIKEKVANAIKSNEYSLGAFLDLAKAYDTANHEILL